MKDFNKLYQLQDKFLTWLLALNMPIYLTGGTALGRFYLDHRYCDGLYFNIDNGTRYLEYISKINAEIGKIFSLDVYQCVFNEDFTRYTINENDVILKIDLVRNVKNHAGKLTEYKYGLVDSPVFILPKKLSALPWRNESKDIFDIISIARNYSFDWADIFINVKRNSSVKIHEIETQLTNFPVESIAKADWIKSHFDSITFKKDLEKVAHDFSKCIENSLGINKTPIALAELI